MEAAMSELRYAVAPIEAVDVRDGAGSFDNTYTMTGYAAVFNETTTLLDSKFVKLTESIDADAFRNVLANQGLATPEGVVHFNFGHDMNRAVAATDVTAGQAGSLELSTDSRGLFFTARVAKDDPDGRAMAVKMRDGVLKQASFAFTIGRADYEEREDQVTEHRTIREVGHLYDVCATTQGAYTSTITGLRSYAATLGEDPVRPDLGSGNDIRPDTGSVVDQALLLEADAALVRAKKFLRVKGK
jgi:HK97 family phage prohead protease